MRTAGVASCDIYCSVTQNNGGWSLGSCQGRCGVNGTNRAQICGLADAPINPCLNYLYQIASGGKRLVCETHGGVGRLYEEHEGGNFTETQVCHENKPFIKRQPWCWVNRADSMERWVAASWAAQQRRVFLYFRGTLGFVAAAHLHPAMHCGHVGFN